MLAISTNVNVFFNILSVKAGKMILVYLSFNKHTRIEADKKEAQLLSFHFILHRF